MGCESLRAIGANLIHQAVVSADGKGRVLLISTFFIILITVLINGGAASYLLTRLRLRAEDGLNFGCAPLIMRFPPSIVASLYQRMESPPPPPFENTNYRITTQQSTAVTNELHVHGRKYRRFGSGAAIAPDGDCCIGEQAVRVDVLEDAESVRSRRGRLALSGAAEGDDLELVTPASAYATPHVNGRATLWAAANSSDHGATRWSHFTCAHEQGPGPSTLLTSGIHVLHGDRVTCVT